LLGSLLIGLVFLSFHAFVRASAILRMIADTTSQATVSVCADLS
jgi:hypothetical protein